MRASGRAGWLLMSAYQNDLPCLQDGRPANVAEDLIMGGVAGAAAAAATTPLDVVKTVSTLQLELCWLRVASMLAAYCVNSNLRCRASAGRARLHVLHSS